MAFETRKDDTPQSTGTHSGVDGASSLYDKNANFDVYIEVGVDCHNTTKGTNGAVIAVTKDTVTVSAYYGEGYLRWDNGDTYEIYCTTTKDSFISSFRIDKMYGRKLTETYSEDYPIPTDISGDEFAPGQPERSHG
jgi:hypothetical protein